MACYRNLVLGSMLLVLNFSSYTSNLVTVFSSINEADAKVSEHCIRLLDFVDNFMFLTIVSDYVINYCKIFSDI